MRADRLLRIHYPLYISQTGGRTAGVRRLPEDLDIGGSAGLGFGLHEDGD